MKIRHIDLDDQITQEHAALGLPPLEEEVTHIQQPSVIKRLVILLAVALSIAAIVYWLAPASIQAGLSSQAFFAALAVGFLAQVVDGALGMAYGVTATSFLMSTGVPPATATASIHIAEIFTTGASGLSHWKLGNINKTLFKRLLIPGIIGVFLGAYIITQFDGKALKPWISGYLILMGGYILYKAFRHIKPRHEAPKHIAALAVTGGFVDAAGGGGWGPVVTTSLIGTGQDPRTTIGSVNAAEFFLTLAGGAFFALFGGFTHWSVIVGLIIGGLFAAPFAALLTRHLPTKALMIFVGVLIITVSGFNLYKALG